jgi:quaternary ammonium compound-resistance protein SugE
LRALARETSRISNWQAASRTERSAFICLLSRLIAPDAQACCHKDQLHMAWVLLSVAGIFEIAFAFGMKWSDGFTRLIPALFTVVTGLSSVSLLSLSLQTLPVGTGYAVWTGIGAAGTAVLGIVALGDSAAPLRISCIALIIAGVIGLKLVSGN